MGLSSKNAIWYSHGLDVIQRSSPLPGGIALFPGADKNNEQYVFLHNSIFKS